MITPAGLYFSKHHRLFLIDTITHSNLLLVLLQWNPLVLLVPTEMSALLMAATCIRVELKCVSMTNGEQSVTTSGMTLMLQWCANS